MMPANDGPLDLRSDPALAAALDEAARVAEARFAAEGRAGAFRQCLRTGLALEWEARVLRSLWLLSHRPLRRAGFRLHADSDAILLAWRGDGLVLLRPAGERRSIPLRPWNAAPGGAGEPFVVVPAGTPYDTLADGAPWHLVVLHTHAGAALRRRQEGPDGWFDLPEEAPS